MPEHQLPVTLEEIPEEEMARYPVRRTKGVKTFVRTKPGGVLMPATWVGEKRDWIRMCVCLCVCISCWNVIIIKHSFLFSSFRLVLQALFSSFFRDWRPLTNSSMSFSSCGVRCSLHWGRPNDSRDDFLYHIFGYMNGTFIFSKILSHLLKSFQVTFSS